MFKENWFNVINFFVIKFFYNWYKNKVFYLLFLVWYYIDKKGEFMNRFTLGQIFGILGALATIISSFQKTRKKMLIFLIFDPIF